MTNDKTVTMSQELIGVPRSLLENAIDYMEGSASPQVNLWRAKLLTCIATMPFNAIAAPFVERQEPVGCVSYIGSGFVRVRTTECLALEQPLYTSPPAPVSVVLDENVEFEKWWCRTPVLCKSRIQIAQEAWEARAALTKPNPMKESK